MRRAVQLILALVCSVSSAVAQVATPEAANDNGPAEPSAGVKQSTDPKQSVAAVKSSRLEVFASPLMGEQAQTQFGWFGYLVQLRNATGRSYSGTLYVTEKPQPWATVKPSLKTALLRTSFAVEAGQTAYFELPVHGYQAHEVEVVAIDEQGRHLDGDDAAHSTAGQALLLDLTQPSRIAKALHANSITLAPTGLAMPLTTLATSVPHTNAKTGELLLPTYAAGYSSVAVVLAESEGLNQLSDARRIALAGWVMAGGTLAVAVTRPEDLRDGALPRFVGATIEQAERANSVSIVASSYVPSESAPIGSGALELKTSIATEDVRLALRAYQGGNLEETDWGSVASYGLGQVHLLAFNPNQAPFLGDTWAEFKLKNLIEHALSRRAAVVSPFGVHDPADWRSEQVRRSLDPNVGNHWVIVACALFLLLYAVVAGPVNFHLASRAGTPLKALRRLPVLSFSAFSMILLLGWASKGGRAKARHLTLVEAGAGMTRATAVRYRAFYAASADDLSVGATEQGNVLDVVGIDGPQKRGLYLERSGFRAADFSVRPWETVLIREDGFINLGQGIAMTEQNGELLITNNSGRDLAAVLVTQKDGALFFHPRINDRESVLASAGQRQSAVRPLSPPRQLPLYELGTVLDGVAPGLNVALEGWQMMADQGDWWPDGVPSLTGQWVGGEGRLTDSGYSIDSDRVVVRVVGLGGEP